MAMYIQIKVQYVEKQVNTHTQKNYCTCSDFNFFVQMICMYRAKLVLDIVCKFALGKIGYLLFIDNIITMTRLIPVGYDMFLGTLACSSL